jgi:hypothetical protein
MGVNLAVIWQFGVRRTQGYRPRFFADVVLPAGGFLFCTAIWWGWQRQQRSLEAAGSWSAFSS